MLNCVKCGQEIRTYKYNGIIFEICKGCGSVIISKDNFEKLAKMIDANCAVVDLFNLKPVNAKEDERICHHCNQNMVKIFYEGVLLDRCDKCQLLFFDNGEFSKYFAKFSNKQIDIMSNALFIKTFCKEAEEVPIEKQEPEKNIQEEENTKVELTKTKKESVTMKIQNKETEKQVPKSDGWVMAGLVLITALVAILLFFSGLFIPAGAALTIFGVILFLFDLFIFGGFKILAPQEAIVFTLFGKYYGTLRNPGFYWVNPFAGSLFGPFGKISLKARTLDNGKQKINDALGNPIEVGIMVTWEVTDTAKAVFNVDDYPRFLSAQCDSALRNIVRLYPYDAPDDSDKQSLRGDSAEISEKLKIEIQEHVAAAGINIIDARITHLAYSSEIAMAMLQRQQANAILDAKKTIVEGAVGMVEVALDRLSKNQNIVLDEKTKASMVNNLLVVLCSSKESQPVVRNDVI